MRYLIRPVLVKREEVSIAPSLPSKKRSWCFIRARDGEEVLQVKVDNFIAADIAEKALVVQLFDGYPTVFAAPASCASCLGTPCGHEKPLLRRDSLHHFVLEKNLGVVPSQDKSGDKLVIHHKNGNKLDARLKNLELLSRAAHAARHNRKQRKFTRRHRESFWPLRHQPRFPSRVKTPENDETLKAMIGMKVPGRPKRPLTLGQRVFALEEVLKSYLPLLKELVAFKGLGQGGATIPRGASSKRWRAAETRNLGLRMPRMACDEAEVALVYLFVFHDLDLDRAAADLNEPVDLLRTVLGRVPVSEAIDRWVKYGRLPEKALRRGWEEVKAHKKKSTARRRDRRSTGQ